MLEFCSDAGRHLIGRMHAMVDEATQRLYTEFGRSSQPLRWVLSAWTNVSRRGDFSQMHTHPGATWSGVYYVDHGQSTLDAEGTVIRLTDPNPARTNIFFPELSASDVTFGPTARVDDPVSELRAACRAAAPGGSSPHFDCIQCAQGTLPLKILD